MCVLQCGTTWCKDCLESVWSFCWSHSRPPHSTSAAVTAAATRTPSLQSSDQRSWLDVSHTSYLQIISQLNLASMWPIWFHLMYKIMVDNAFFIGEILSIALPYWWLDAKRPYLLPSSKPRGPQSSRTEGQCALCACCQNVTKMKL